MSRPLQSAVNGTPKSNEIPPTPTSPSLNYPDSTLKSRRSLKQLWDEADKRFFDETGYHISTAAPLHKDGVLQKWQGRYNGEKSSMQDRMDKLSPILQNIVNGIEIVGGFAASAASAVFGPAQMCFSAITFVLDAPGKIKQVYDCLEALFKEVAQFLVRFKVLDRIDEKGRLDVELLENANKLLISFTQICAVATKLLKRKRHVLQALEIVFLMNDGGVQAALTDFKALANNQAQTVGVISLEHILENEHLSHQILAEQSKVSVYLQSISTRENDEKTRMINTQKIANLTSKLFSGEDLEQLEQPIRIQPSSDMLLGTLDILMASREYLSWSSADDVGTSELYLSGSTGSGKTYFVNALRAYLDQKRQHMPKQAPSLYVAHHSFSDRRTNASPRNMVARALKNVALQVAKQSTRYAAELSDQLRDRNLIVEDDSAKIWSLLKLVDFGPPPGSVMYLLIDGLEGEDGFNSMQVIRKLLADARTMDAVGGRFKLCILLAGLPKVIHHVSVHRSKVIDMEKLNGKLLAAFIDRELKAEEILTEAEEKIQAQRSIFATALFRQSKGDFHAAKQKIKRIKAALDEDATISEVEAVIEEDGQEAFDQQARNTLDALADGLSPRHLEQLKKILMWMLYGMPSWYFEVRELQAVLRIDQKDQTLESLSKKITKRFHKVINIRQDRVDFNPGMQDHLRQFKHPDPPRPVEDSRFISMSINIQNATKAEIQSFVLDLNARLASDTSMFPDRHATPQECRIRIVEVEALTEIALLSLTALNEELPDDADAAFDYAFTWLPTTLTELMKLREKVPSAKLKKIQSELITFLSEPYFVANRPDSTYFGLTWQETWFGESKAAKCFSTCLHECLEDLPSQRHLQPRQRRWLKQAATRNNGRPDYLRDVALAIGGRWRAACLEEKATEVELCREWLARYLEFVANVEDLRDDRGEALASAESHAISIDHQDESTVDTVDIDPAVAQLYKVADWVEKTTCIVQDTGAHFYCIAKSLCQISELNAAATFFERARSDVKIGWRATIGLAQIKREQDLPEEATILLREAISLAREVYRDQKLARHEFTLFVDSLETMARILVDATGQMEAALPYLREILRYSPQHSQYRWNLFIALCMVGNFEEASQFLDAWANPSGEYGDRGPCEALYSMATTIAELVSLFEATQQRELRDKLLRVLQQAADNAGSRSQCIEQTQMLYVLATAHDSSSSRESYCKALQCLEDILDQSQTQLDNQYVLDDIVRKTLRFASRLKFDDIRHRIETQASANKFSPQALRDDLYRYISRIGAASGKGGLLDPYWHVASLCRILKQPEWSRDLLKQNVAHGVEILSDDDPENDCAGVWYLMRAFSCYGSDVDALIVYSLLDRTVRKGRLLGDEDCDGPEYENQDRPCSICDAYLVSLDGYWVCRWCPHVYFCTSCMGQFREGKKYHEHCDPNHDFFHLQHAQCGEEELEPGKVFIDWVIQNEEDGSFSRKGGCLADIGVWLERLRVEWDLPVPLTDVARAQA